MGHPSIPEFGPTPQHASTAEGEEDKEEGGAKRSRQAGRKHAGASADLGRVGGAQMGARGEGF